MRYEIQKINSKKDGINYRITDTNSDSRIATCFMKENAELVCKALNLLDEENSGEKIVLRTVLKKVK